MARKIAIVGLGKIARDQHIPSISTNPAFELAATASRNASIGGVDAYRDLAELIAARPDIDCVSLCTPPQPRYPDALRAIRAGRHVMLEKPPGATLSEVHHLIAEARDAGVTLFATWHSRYAASAVAAKSWLQDKTIRAVRITWKEDVRRWHPGQEWIWQAGGLGVFDPGINALSLVTAILSRPIHLTAATLAFPANRETPIAADLVFAGPDGAAMTASFDWRQEGPQTWDIDVETDAGHLKLSLGGARAEVDGVELASGPDREYEGLYARFAHLLEQGESDVDLTPMTLVADAFTLGRRMDVEPFEF